MSNHWLELEISCSGLKCRLAGTEMQRQQQGETGHVLQAGRWYGGLVLTVICKTDGSLTFTSTPISNSLDVRGGGSVVVIIMYPNVHISYI